MIISFASEEFDFNNLEETPIFVMKKYIANILMNRYLLKTAFKKDLITTLERELGS